jgi:hypothetical protein
VQHWYGVIYQSTVSYYPLFARCAVSYHRPTKMFKSRNEAAVTDFEAQIEKLIDMVQDAPDTVVLAMDEASL